MMQKYMKLNLIFICAGFLFILLCPQIYAQEQQYPREKAEKLFKEYQYARAVELYKKLTDVSLPKINDMEHLAECYKKMNKYKDAEIWYERVVANPESNLEDLFNYGEILKSNARYSEAKKVFQDYLAKAGNNRKVLTSMAGCDSASLWIANPSSHLIKNEEAINTDLSEFSVFPIGGQQFNYTGEPQIKNGRKRYGWTGNSFLRIFLAERTIDDNLKPMGLLRAVNDDASYHVGPVSTNKTGNIYFITRTYPGKRGDLSRVNRNLYRTQNMELYIQTKIYGQWQKPVPFAYNDVKKYSLGHAALSPDEKVLYFVSDMPGGRGGTDIWFSEIQPDGSWGKCFNAGHTINTSGDEMFPTVASDGTLYYSSNGLPGMGGLDIYYSKGSLYQWDKPVNMGYPVNSPGDDFSYVLNNDLKSGYFSSNRVNGKGGDDIYSFVNQKPNKLLTIKGIVYDKKTGFCLSDANVTLSDSSLTILAKQMSKPDGSFSFTMNKIDFYKLKGTKDRYYPDTAIISGQNALSDTTRIVALYLDPLFEKGKTFRLENIHYNFDKDNIRSDASVILDGLVEIMHENPTLNIELASHTDCRGTDAYNQNLSQRRAQSAVDYIVSRGISRSRMVAKGYGESRLINRCADGVPCSEAEHQENRRTEFTVTSY